MDIDPEWIAKVAEAYRRHGIKVRISEDGHRLDAFDVPLDLAIKCSDWVSSEYGFRGLVWEVYGDGGAD